MFGLFICVKERLNNMGIMRKKMVWFLVVEELGKIGKIVYLGNYWWNIFNY